MGTRRGNPLQFVDIHGQPLGGAQSLGRTVKDVSVQRRADEVAAALSPADVEQVFDALVIAGWKRGKTAVAPLLRALGSKREGGRGFGHEETGAALRRLAADGRVVIEREGEGWSVPEALAEQRLPVLLERPEAAHWWRAWVWAANGAHGPVDGPPPHYCDVRNNGEALALVRLLLLSGIDASGYAAFANGSLRQVNSTGAVLAALAQLQRVGLFERVDLNLRWRLLAALDTHNMLARAPALMAWVQAHLGDAPADAATGLRFRVAEQRLQAGDHAGITRALGTDPQALPFAPLLLALWPAREGRFADTAAAVPPAWKGLCAHLGKKRGFMPDSLLQWYPMALMAQPDAAAWTTARKFCVAMSGSRDPSPFDAWGRWAHALAVRLGDARLEARAFEAGPHADLELKDADRWADRLVLAAWLNKPPAGWTEALLVRLMQGLLQAGLPWKADLVAQACEHLGWPQLPMLARPADAPAAWPVRYFAPPQAAWRDALAAITALGDGSGAIHVQPAATLRWRLTLDKAGRVHNLEAFEMSASGRGKPKPVSPAQLKKRTRLDPRDAAVARCLRVSRYRAADISLDLVQAASALVGHPALELADAPDVEVELQESLPVLEVRRERVGVVAGDGASGGSGGAGSSGNSSEHYVFRLHDELLADDSPGIKHHLPDYDQIEAEAARRDSLRIVRESPGRARLVRISAARQRVAELIAQHWTVPADAGSAELEAALRVLSSHFILHSDAAAGEPVPSDARLVAQLQPRGDAMRLSLGVRPFGDFGPLLAPGRGRARLMTLHHGVSLATERELDRERSHLGAVLEELPFLGGLGGSEADAEAETMWQLDDPEHALAAVHALGRLAGEGLVLRALEWPKGRPLRVFAPEAKAFAATLRSRRGWFELEAELQIDEQRVLSLQQLLGLLREARGSRFVALGDGDYLTLTEQLRQRLAELEAVGEADGAQMKA